MRSSSNILHLEAESARRGMTQVKANRVITVASEKERLAFSKAFEARRRMLAGAG